MIEKIRSPRLLPALWAGLIMRGFFLFSGCAPCIHISRSSTWNTSTDALFFFISLLGRDPLIRSVSLLWRRYWTYAGKKRRVIYLILYYERLEAIKRRLTRIWATQRQLSKGRQTPRFQCDGVRISVTPYEKPISFCARDLLQISTNTLR